MEEKKKRTQINFDIQQEIHTQIKILAAIRNISMNCWLMRAIQDRIAKETKYDQNNNMSPMQD